VNAISLPFGDQEKLLMPSSELVSFSASPPFSVIRYSCRLPSRSETNASELPSGENAGCVLDFFELVSWCGWPAAVSAIQISVS
jgi:hypothetical protein